MMIFFRLLLAICAIAMIVFGAIMSLSPIPFGFVIVIFGFLLLAGAAPGFVRWMRKRSRRFDKVMHGIERILPKVLAKHLHDTDYDHGDEEDDDEEDDDEEDDDDGEEEKSKKENAKRRRA